MANIQRAGRTDDSLTDGQRADRILQAFAPRPDVRQNESSRLAWARQIVTSVCLSLWSRPDVRTSKRQIQAFEAFFNVSACTNDFKAAKAYKPVRTRPDSPTSKEALKACRILFEYQSTLQ